MSGTWRPWPPPAAAAIRSPPTRCAGYRARFDGLPFAVEELVAAPHGRAAHARLPRGRPSRRPRRARTHCPARGRGARPGARLAAARPDRRHRRGRRAGRCAPGSRRRCWSPTVPRCAGRTPSRETLSRRRSCLRAGRAGRAAHVLAERAGPTTSARAAELFVEAGEPDAAARLLLRLARRDAARGALRSAEQHLAAAADARPGAELAAAVAVERVAVLTLVGRASDALALGCAARGRAVGCGPRRPVPSARPHRRHRRGVVRRRVLRHAGRSPQRPAVARPARRRRPRRRPPR